MQGKAEAIAEAEQLKLEDNQFYHALLGELYQDLDHAKARQHLEQALALAKNQTDRHTLHKKITALGV